MTTTDRAPYVVPTTDGLCAGCGEKLWFPNRYWAHRRCALVLQKHRQPFITRNWIDVWAARMRRRDSDG